MGLTASFRGGNTPPAKNSAWISGGWFNRCHSIKSDLSLNGSAFAETTVSLLDGCLRGFRRVFTGGLLDAFFNVQDHLPLPISDGSADWVIGSRGIGYKCRRMKTK